MRSRNFELIRHWRIIGGFKKGLFERGETLRDRTIIDLASALESAGVEFIAENGGSAGVRFRKNKP